jgi:hypothetical protein
MSEEQKVIDLLFEVYSAGYIDGFNHDKNPDIDIATSFRQWLKSIGITISENK